MLPLLIICLLIPWIAAGTVALANRSRQRLRARLVRAACAHLELAEDLSDNAARVESFQWLAQLMGALGIRERVEAHLKHMDLRVRPGEYVATLLTIWVAVPVLLWVMGQGPLVIAGALVFLVGLPRLAGKMSQGWRKRQFAGQLPNALDMIASSLRVGHGLQRALSLVASETEAPLATEMKRALTEIAIGSSVDTALQRAAERVQSRDLDLLATVVGIQMQVGGNMAEVFDRIGETLRERDELARELKSLTAEGMMTAYVCIGMPPAMGLLVYYLNPSYMRPMISTTPGWIMMAVVVVMQLVGGAILKKMMKLED